MPSYRVTSSLQTELRRARGTESPVAVDRTASRAQLLEMIERGYDLSGASGPPDAARGAIAAPSPIEQRWSAASSSRLSPAASDRAAPPGARAARARRGLDDAWRGATRR